MLDPWHSCDASASSGCATKTVSGGIRYSFSPPGWTNPRSSHSTTAVRGYSTRLFAFMYAGPVPRLRHAAHVPTGMPVAFESVCGVNSGGIPLARSSIPLNVARLQLPQSVFR